MSRGEGRPAASLPRSLTCSLPGCGCCNRGGGGGGGGSGSSGSSLEAGVEVRREWTEAAGRNGRTESGRREGCTGIRAPGGPAGGAGRTTPMGGSGAGPPGARKSLGEGLGRGSEEIPRSPREGRGRLRPKGASSKPHRWAPREEGRMDAGGVECEFRGSLPSLPIGVHESLNSLLILGCCGIY